MNKIIFVIGGIRSGKSHYVVEQVKILSQKTGKMVQGSQQEVVFVATSKRSDAEMKKRILLHQQNRPSEWMTIEEPENIVQVIKQIKRDKIVVIDCLNTWVANCIADKKSEQEILETVKKMVTVLRKNNNHCFLVSNEVGSSLVSVNKIGRKFQDLLGKVNQIVAELADEVYLMVAGIPVKIKKSMAGFTG